jgi:hypothetical protein
MKTATKISIITLMAINMAQAEGHYEVKSAKIELKITSTQTVGSISNSETGTKRIVVGNYGEQELEEINTVIKNTTNGKTKVNKIHKIKYINGDIRYVADFNKKTMHRSTHYAGILFGTKKYKGSVEKMLKLQKMKKIGTDTVAGHTCDVWQLGDIGKTCFYKGFPLREETTLMGMKRVIVATKAEFDITLSKDDFKMPDFPVYTMRFSEDGQPIGEPKKFNKNELEEMDKKYIEKSKKGEDEEAKMIKIMNEAYTKAGVVKGKAPTKEQMNMAKEYMQKAMFPIQKKKFLEEAKESGEVKNCLEKANSIKDANHCKPDGDGYEKWDSTVKKEKLEEILMFETKILPCVEKAKDTKMMEACFPKD